MEIDCNFIGQLRGHGHMFMNVTCHSTCHLPGTRSCYERTGFNACSFLSDSHGLLLPFTPIALRERDWHFPFFEVNFELLLGIEEGVSLHTWCCTKFQSGGLCFLFYQTSQSAVIPTQAERRSLPLPELARRLADDANLL